MTSTGTGQHRHGAGALVDLARQARREHRTSDAITLLERARDVALTAGDDLTAARAVLALGTCQESVGDLAAVGRSGRAVLDLLGDRYEPTLLAGAHAMLAVDAGHRDDQPELLQQLAAARAHIEVVSEPSHELVRAVNQAADAYLSVDCFSDAHALYRRLARECGDLDDGFALAWTHCCLAITTAWWAEFVAPVDTALAHRLWRESADEARAALELERTLDSPFVRVTAAPALALALASVEQAGPREGQDAIAALDALTDDIDASDRAVVDLARARASRLLGDHESARRHVQHVLDHDVPAAERTADVADCVLAAAHRERLLLARASGDLAEQVAALERVAAAADRRRVAAAAQHSAAVAAQVRSTTMETQLGEQGRRIRTLTDLSNTDALTGLLNRRGLVEQLGELGDGVGEVGVAVVDVDRFKQVNDTLSHATGDAVLARLSGLLRAACRSDDLVGRLGGDEFVVVTAVPQAAAAVGSRLLDSVHRQDWSDLAGALPISVSIGIGTAPRGPGGSGTDLATLIEHADTALRAAKTSGRDRVVASA